MIGPSSLKKLPNLRFLSGCGKKCQDAKAKDIRRNLKMGLQ